MIALRHRWRKPLKAIVQETKTPAGRFYNVLVFGAILLSVLALLMDPNPLTSSVVRGSAHGWIQLIQSLCLLVFVTDFVLNVYVRNSQTLCFDFISTSIHLKSASVNAIQSDLKLGFCKM